MRNVESIAMICRVNTQFISYLSQSMNQSGAQKNECSPSPEAR